MITDPRKLIEIYLYVITLCSWMVVILLLKALGADIGSVWIWGASAAAGMAGQFISGRIADRLMRKVEEREYSYAE